MKKFIYTVIKLIYKLYKTITLKDSCKDCLVRACCTAFCDKRKKVQYYITPYRSIKASKRWAWISIFIITISSTEIILLIFSFVNM